MKRCLLILALVLVLPLASALSCDNTTITATEPQDLNYTYSVQIPVEYSTNLATNCWVYVDSNKFQNNFSLACSETSRPIDVDYDGEYTANFWAINTTSSEECNTTLTFSIDRTSEFFEGKLNLIMIITIILVIIAFFIVKFSAFLEDKFKTLGIMLSFIFAYVALSMLLVISREYVKVPAIHSTLETLYSVTVYASLAIGMIILVYFIVNIYVSHLKKVEKTRFGYEK